MLVQQAMTLISKCFMIEYENWREHVLRAESLFRLRRPTPLKMQAVDMFWDGQRAEMS